MGVPINYNLRNLVERKATTLMTAFGIGLTVAVLVTSIAMLRERTSGQHIVIQKNTIEYVAPVTADFTATCAAPPPADWQRFLRTFEQRGRARVHLAATVDVGETLAAKFGGRFAVLLR